MQATLLGDISWIRLFGYESWLLQLTHCLTLSVIVSLFLKWGQQWYLPHEIVSRMQ